MDKKKMKGISHPMDDYKFFLEICTDTITNTLEQFSMPFHSLAKEHVKEWQNAFMNSSDVFSMLPLNWPNPSQEKISQLKKETDIQRNRINQLETELNEKSILLKEHVKQIANLKKELSIKKREITIELKKRETLSKQLFEQQKITKETKTIKQLPKKDSTR